MENNILKYYTREGLEARVEELEESNIEAHKLIGSLESKIISLMEANKNKE